MISVSGEGDTLAYADYSARSNIFRLSLSADGPFRAEDATPVTFEEQRKLVSVADARIALSMFFAVVDEQIFFSMGTFEGDVSVRTLSRQ